MLHCTLPAAHDPEDEADDELEEDSDEESEEESEEDSEERSEEDSKEGSEDEPVAGTAVGAAGPPVLSFTFALFWIDMANDAVGAAVATALPLGGCT